MTPERAREILVGIHESQAINGTIMLPQWVMDELKAAGLLAPGMKLNMGALKKLAADRVAADEPAVLNLVQRWLVEIFEPGFQHYGSWMDLAVGFALGAGATLFTAGAFTADIEELRLIPKQRGHAEETFPVDKA